MYACAPRINEGRDALFDRVSAGSAQCGLWYSVIKTVYESPVICLHFASSPIEAVSGRLQLLCCCTAREDRG
jgi:hypothetical protein